MERNNGRQLRSQTGENASGRHATQGPLNQETKILIQELTDEVEKNQAQLRRERHRYSSLEGNFRKARNEVKALINEKEISNIRTRKMQTKWSTVMLQVVIPYARGKHLRMDEKTGEFYDDVLGPLSQDALRAQKLQGDMEQLQQRQEDINNKSRDMGDNIQNLQDQNQALYKQVLGLQKDALSRIEQMQIVSDNQFERDFQVLASSIKAFSRSVRFPDDMNVPNVLTSPGFLEDVSEHHWEGRARKKTFLEAWIWTILIKRVFRNPFTILGENVKYVHKAWIEMFGDEHHHEWPVPTAVCENWRRTTIEHLHESMNEAFRLDSDVEPKFKRKKTTSVDPRKKLADEAEEYLEARLPASNCSQLRGIIDKAFALAKQMSLQRCRLQITYPSTGCIFVESEMTSVPDRDGDDINDGVVAFVVNPGLTKWGDARGEKLDERYDIVPCLVQLEPMRIKREDGVDHRSGDVEFGIAGRLDANGVLHPQGQADWSQKTNIPIVKQEPE
ncbi:uncharacterized protein J4E87_006505 [Alternaria ethzedia]|uniref:uncharacterized protein n=1 Tax=Alternaria ethzedia TaxID=181014 RepID=UPI0020C582CD|nr:uncharacterized protein J4E87_006505 [Alternaria ethzedia]KAI4622563.1 hypothetical protein J4E87_006505 [Alternaria ethzedia]